MHESHVSFLQKIINRIDEICKKAFENKVSLFIDAEDSWYQDFIDSQAELMILKYNKDETIIYNTIQLYRHDRFNYMKKLIAKCESNNCYLGLKLVRGAYMEKEREFAFKNGLLDPIHSSKDATDLDFNKAIKYCVSKINLVSICVGTHNELSVQYLTKLMLKMKLSKNDKRIYFAQLLGMSDHISFTLTNKGYNVVKFVPFGPMDKLIPYLARRAEENTSIAGQTSRELLRLRIELKRRILANER